VRRLTVPYEIHICRIAPSVTSVVFEWFDISRGEGSYTVHYKKTSDDRYMSFETDNSAAALTGLETGADYEFYVTGGSRRSRIRLARTGYVPGITVNYLHPGDEAFSFSGRSLCSPSIIKHPDGFLMASMDVFGGAMPQNLSFVYRSDDGGETWYYVCDLFPCFWGKLFIHRGEIYMLAMSTEYGDILIGRYDGKDFCLPTVIARGSCSARESGFHHAPMPVTEHAGRLWTAVEYGAWSVGTHAMTMLSADAEGDLLDASIWTIAEPLPYNPDWQGTVEGESAGCIEGSAVVSPDGELYNILRYQTNGCIPSYGKAMVLRVDTSEPEKRLAFSRVIDFPGNLSKFDILYDPQSAKYWTICSRIIDASHAGARNLLSLASSDNLFDWEVNCDLLDYRDSDSKKTGFQYVSFVFDGDDLLYLCRTAHNGARNFHDANHSTFHRIKNFRKL
jgi:hypothetical protein